MLGMNTKWKVFYTSLQPHGGYTDEKVNYLPTQPATVYRITLAHNFGHYLHATQALVKGKETWREM